jgi:predicted nuclease of predicted toxin-antitoxin system
MHRTRGAQWLIDQGHNVFSVYDESRGITDDEVVKKVHNEERILVTNDKDFGEKLFREKKPHKGVILYGWKTSEQTTKSS